MSRPEKINLTQIGEAFAPVIKLTAESLSHLGVPFEKDRSAVLMQSSQLANLAEGLARFVLMKRDDFLGITQPEPAPRTGPAVQWLPADDTEGGST